MTERIYHIKRVPLKNHGVSVRLSYYYDGQWVRKTLGRNLSDDEADRRAIACLHKFHESLTTEHERIGPSEFEHAVGHYYEILELKQALDQSRPRQLIKKHLIPFFAGTPLQSLHPTHGVAYIQHRRKQGAAEGTIKREWNVLQRVLKIAVDYGLMTANPLSVVPAPKGHKRIRIVTDDEFERLHQMGDRDVWRAIVVGYATMLRESLILGIRGADLHPRNDGWWLQLPAARSPIKGNPLWQPLNDLAKDALAPDITQCGPGRVFDRWATRSGFLQAFRKVCVAANIEGLHFHDIRHTSLTRLQNEGVRYEIRQVLAGHRVPGKTADYSHGGEGFNRQLRDAVKTLSLTHVMSKKP